MNDLPTEVYYHILRYLSRPEIYTCFFVCRRLNYAAVQIYSEELIIDDYKVKLAKCYLASYDPSIYFQNRHLVRKLIFKSKHGDGIEWFQSKTKASGEKIPSAFSFSKAEFLLLLKCFPNIEEIDLAKSGKFSNYISFLFDADLQYIKKIKTFEQNSGTNNYYKYLSTCFKFCGTLTSLFLDYTEYTKNYTFCGVGILDMPSHFKNLKQLKFNNSYSDNLIMFRIQELCLQLTDLKFTSNFNRSEQRVEHTVKLNKKLRHLYINLPSLSINYTKDLTRYLEDTLHTVNIQVSFTGLYFWIENVGIENSLNLMKKLGQLNDVCISFRRSNGSLRTRRLTYAIKMTWWFQVVNAFKGDKKALCTVKFCGTSSSQDYFKYSALDNQLILAYTLEDVDYRALENINYNESEYVYYNEREDANHYVREDEIDEAVHYEREDVYYSEREYEYYSEIDEADFYESENVYYGERGYDSHIYRPCESLSKSALPISFISIIGPEIIDRVELNLEEVSDNVVTKFLDYLFIKCINLQYLKVTGYFQIQRRPNHRNEELNGTQNNLKTLHFLSGAPANNILNSIFKHLPDIEVLVLGTRGKYNSSLDLRQFKSLRRCYIIIQQTSTYNCEALTIKFNCTDGKKRQYYYDGAVKKTLVREDIRGSIRICRSFTFTFEKETEFFVYFDSGESILNFNIDKHPDSCIPVNFI